MTYIKKEDFIVHSANQMIKSISIAQTDCYEADRPDYTTAEENLWDKQGYMVNTLYKDLDQPLKLSNHREWLIENYRPNSAFLKDGRGKQQYMCLLDEDHAIYFLEEAIKIQNSEEAVRVLKRALQDIIGEKESEYDVAEKQVIDNLVDNEADVVPEWTGEQRAQEMTTASFEERQKPKRNPKVAAAALQRAGYQCEFNPNDRIFLRKNNKGYTEPHHLIPISQYRDFDYTKYSLDVMENIVSLCSHCHNLLHYGKMEDKIPLLKKLYEDRQAALAQVGLEISFEELKAYYE